MLPTGAAAVPLLGPPPRGPSLLRRRPNPRIELVPEPEPELDPEPQPEQTSLPALLKLSSSQSGSKLGNPEDFGQFLVFLISQLGSCRFCVYKI